VVARKVLVRRHVGAGGQSVGGRGIAHPLGELRPGGRALHQGRRRCLADGRIASHCGACDLTPFHSRLEQALARAPSVSRC
jgi:hypothetical protein